MTAQSGAVCLSSSERAGLFIAPIRMNMQEDECRGKYCSFSNGQNCYSPKLCSQSIFVCLFNPVKYCMAALLDSLSELFKSMGE